MKNRHLADRVAARTMLEMVYSFIEANKWHHEAAIRVAVARRELEAALQALINLQEDAHAARDADALLACIKTIDEIAARYSKKAIQILYLSGKGGHGNAAFGFM